MNFSTDGRSADSTEIQRVIQYGIYPLEDTGIATRGECLCLLAVPAIFDPSRFLLLDTEQRHSGCLHSSQQPATPRPTPGVRARRTRVGVPCLCVKHSECLRGAPGRPPRGPSPVRTCTGATSARRQQPEPEIQTRLVQSLGDVYTTACYLPVRCSEVLVQATTWRNLENIILHQRSQPQRTTFYTSSLTERLE